MNKLNRLAAMTFLIITLTSCGPKKSGPVTDAKVFIGALTGFSNSLMLYGGSIDADHSFARKILPGENEIALELQEGTWNFYALYWDGAGAFSGNMSCYFGEQSVQGESMEINISLSQSACNNTVFFPSSLDAQDTFKLQGCAALDDVTDESSSCDGINMGHGQSYRLTFPQWSLSKIEEAKGNATPGMVSNCITKGTDSTIKFPIGSMTTFFSPVIESFSNSTCTGNSNPLISAQTFGKVSNPSTKEYSDGSNNYLYFLDRGEESLKLITSTVGKMCDSILEMQSIGSNTVFLGPDTNYQSSLYTIDEESEIVTPLLPDHEATAKLTKFGNQVIFKSTNSTYGSEVWITDGTAPGTYMLKDIYVGATGSYANDFTVFNGKVYFAADSDGYGVELWSTDGTSLGTNMVQDFNTGAGDGVAMGGITVYNGSLYFVGNDGANGNELTKMDAGEVITTVEDLNTGGGNSDIQKFFHFDNRLYFIADDGASDLELYSHDGSTTTKLTDFTAVDPFGWAPGFTVFGGSIVFSADAGDGVYGMELYYHDGVTPNSEGVLKDYNTGSLSSSPIISKITSTGELIVSADAGGGIEVFTVFPDLVTFGNPGPGVITSRIEDQIVFNNKDYLILGHNTNGSSLYRYDGSAGSLVKVQGLCEGNCSFSPLGAFGISAQNKLYIKKTSNLSGHILRVFRMGF